MRRQQTLSASLFGIPVGILGLAGAWNVGVRLWHLEPVVAHVLAVLGALLWFALLGLHAYKWYAHRSTALEEFQNPIQSSFIALAPISTMLVASNVLGVSRITGIALFATAVIAAVALGTWLLGRIWQGGNGPDFITPAMYLPGVGQSFVAASVAAAVGWPQVAMWLFGCGALSWLATESVVMARAATREPIAITLRPAIGIQLAPPAVGGLAYLSMTSGPPDLAAHMLFGYAVYQAALLSRLWRWIRQPSFAPTYWSISFGVTALPTMAMRMVERGDAGPLLWIAPLLFFMANLVVLYLAASCLRLLRADRPSHPPVPMPGANAVRHAPKTIIQ
jgi:tellurite resistance protein